MDNPTKAIKHKDKSDKPQTKQVPTWHKGKEYNTSQLHEYKNFSAKDKINSKRTISSSTGITKSSSNKIINTFQKTRNVISATNINSNMNKTTIVQKPYEEMLEKFTNKNSDKFSKLNSTFSCSNLEESKKEVNFIRDKNNNLI